VDPDGFITLTDEGLAVAKKIFERHTVVSQLLIRLGVSEQTAAEDACKIEHVISDETFNAVKKYLDTSNR
jgi:Mn-dependent DtxR family transcriptional regulator